MASVDLCFPVLGTSIPLDHGYALYAAISHTLGPALHSDNGLGVFPIRGVPAAGLLQLDKRSALRIRTDTEHLSSLLALAGKPLELGGYRVRIGVPRTLGLVLAATLGCRMATVKGFRDPEPFLDAVRRQLDAMQISGQAAIPLRASGPHQGEPIRRVLRIKDKKVVGFGLIVSGLTAEESLLLQERGLGGRRHMGCGLFLPVKTKEAKE